MGALVATRGIEFTVAVPEGKKGVLVLEHDGGEERIPLTEEFLEGRAASVLVRGRNVERYRYRYEFDGEPTMDPYATVVRGGWSEIASERGEGPKPIDVNISEMSIYRLNVRSFTMSFGSKTRYRGTYKALIPKAKYIAGLGFTAVMLMPCYEFDAEIKRIPPAAAAEGGKAKKPVNLWGYSDTNYYFSPNERYSATTHPVREVRNMVEALHGEGLACIVEFYAPEGTDAVAFIAALRYWRRTFGVDGFRLLGPAVPKEMAKNDPYISDAVLFMEGVGGDGPFAKAPARRRLVEYDSGFSSVMRSFVKSDAGRSTDFMNFLRRNAPDKGYVNYICDGSGFTLRDLVTYNEKHNEANGEENRDGEWNNFSWNCGEEGHTRKRAILLLRKRQMLNALCCLFLSQGIPLMSAGDEMGNSQDGNNNGYMLDNALGWVDWGKTRQYAWLTDAVKFLLAFRKAHPILHMEGMLRGSDYRSIGLPDISFHSSKAWYSPYEADARSVGVLFVGPYARTKDGSDAYIYAGFNAYWEPYAFAVPKIPDGFVWKRVYGTAGAEPGFEDGFDGKTFVTPERSVTILVSEPVPEEAKPKKASKKKAAAKGASVSENESPEAPAEKKASAGKKAGAARRRKAAKAEGAKAEGSAKEGEAAAAQSARQAPGTPSDGGGKE